jgi:hypothetical protein
MFPPLIRFSPACLLQNTGTDATAIACCIAPFVLLGLGIALSAYSTNQRNKAIRHAWDSYQRCLDRLKSDPMNPNLKHRRFS